MQKNIKASSQNTQRFNRYSFHCEGYLIINHERIDFVVENVSNLGLKAHVHDQICLKKNYAMKIKVGILKDVEIIVRAIWDNHENTVGFEVLNNNEHWKQFIAQIEHEKAKGSSTQSSLSKAA